MDLNIGNIKQLLDISTRLQEISAKLDQILIDKPQESQRIRRYLLIIKSTIQKCNLVKTSDQFESFMKDYEKNFLFIDCLEKEFLKNP